MATGNTLSKTLVDGALGRHVVTMTQHKKVRVYQTFKDRRSRGNVR